LRRRWTGALRQGIIHTATPGNFGIRVETTGESAAIQLTPDRATFKADGRNVSVPKRLTRSLPYRD
jgi:hypothetical protein